MGPFVCTSTISHSDLFYLWWVITRIENPQCYFLYDSEERSGVFHGFLNEFQPAYSLLVRMETNAILPFLGVLVHKSFFFSPLFRLLCIVNLLACKSIQTFCPKQWKLYFFTILQWLILFFFSMLFLHLFF